LFYIQNKILVR